MSALILVLEIGRELGVDVFVEMRRWSDTDIKCSIDKEEKRLTRGEDGAAEERRRNPRRRACCWPSVQEKGRKAGVFSKGLRKEKTKEALADGGTIVPMG